MALHAATTNALALGAAVAAGIALVLGTVLAVLFLRMRRAQKVVLGGAGERDLVSHAEAMQVNFEALQDLVEDAVRKVQDRTARNEAEVRRCVRHTAVVRYDAWGELSGEQSSSLALLDSHQNGVVMSSIVHRDQARLYVKPVRAGGSEYELSPEEREAIRVALAPAAASSVAPSVTPPVPVHRRGEPEQPGGEPEQRRAAAG